MRRIVATTALSGVLCLAPGCSLIMNGSYQDVSLNSNPSGAAVSLNCGKGSLSSPVTPTTAKLQRKAPTCTATLTKTGYEDISITWLKHGNYWWIADIPLFGLLSIITIPISVATGSTSSYDPETTAVTLAARETK